MPFWGSADDLGHRLSHRSRQIFANRFSSLPPAGPSEPSTPPEVSSRTLNLTAHPWRALPAAWRGRRRALDAADYGRETEHRAVARCPASFRPLPPPLPPPPQHRTSPHLSKPRSRSLVAHPELLLLALRGGTSWFTLYLVFHWQWPSALQSLLCRRFCYLCRDYKL
jgi:hypothetical protein